MAAPTGVHFVGSIPLKSTEEVLNRICSTVPHHIRTIPDGETGERDTFVRWQVKLFPLGILKDQMLTRFGIAKPPLVPENLPSILEKIRTGYEDAALESYQIFKDMKDSGRIPDHVKFQVGLPSTVNGLASVKKDYQPLVEPYYEAALLRSARTIQDNIPHQDLAIQIDCAIDFAMLEGAYRKSDFAYMEPWFEPIEEGVLERLVRCARQIDPDVELGFHLCYGDVANKHFVEPKDTAMIAKVIRRLHTDVTRKIGWIHLPVPKDRDDVAYLQPLAEVLPALTRDGTIIYLGLVHAGDESGTKRRIAIARECLGPDIEWGIGTECGMGRTPPEKLSSILEISGKLAQPVR
jgi:hypothetical protein